MTSEPTEPTKHSTRLDLLPEDAAQAVSEAAEVWGAGLEDWDRERRSGILHLPVAAGLRHGMVHGRLSVEPDDGGSRVVFHQETSEYRLQSTSVAFLCLSAIGAILVVLWPFFPPDSGWMQAAPLGVVLALAGWFLVTSRIITRDVGSFFELLREMSDPTPPDAPDQE